MIQFCPNCKHRFKYTGFTEDGALIYVCPNCSTKWVIKEEEEDDPQRTP